MYYRESYRVFDVLMQEEKELDFGAIHTVYKEIDGIDGVSVDWDIAIKDHIVRLRVASSVDGVQGMMEDIMEVLTKMGYR